MASTTATTVLAVRNPILIICPSFSLVAGARLIHIVRIAFRAATPFARSGSRSWPHGFGARRTRATSASLGGNEQRWIFVHMDFESMLSQIQSTLIREPVAPFSG